MSHFTVAVFTKDEHQDVDDLLAPYNESITVAPYVDLTKEELIRREREQMHAAYSNSYAQWQKDPIAYEKTANPEHIQYLKSLPERMQWTDEQVYEEAIKSYDEEDITSDGSLLSRYNPDSKWDWYEVGGRWQGMLILKTGKTGERGTPGLMTKITKNFDAACVTDIDFDAMRKKQLEGIQPYQEALKSSFYKEEYMRERYPTETEYIQRMTAFRTYSVLTPDGVWHAPGDMGWWGMSSETTDEERDWQDNYYDRFIKPAISKGWYLTIVDCHI